MIQMSVTDQDMVDTGLFINTQLCRNPAGVNNHPLVNQKTTG
jgi:hypothetical protein